jgi:DNA (cytosine-5)-methyltransferase 1
VTPAPRFIDLFCGIGGFRLAFSRAGAHCVFSSDWDRWARRTYQTNFGEEPAGDIRSIAATDIPAHDILCGGFPCQPFSLAGVSKKLSLGRQHGFDDERQGNLFFEITRILRHHQPAAFVLENVKNLTSHDQGRTFTVIREALTTELGYHLHHRILDARHWLPQHRERIFLVGFRQPTPFCFPSPPDALPAFSTILESAPDPKYTLSDKLWTYLQEYARKHQAKGNGFGCSVVTAADATTRTLSARYYKDGSEILVSQGHDRNPRRLTPRECARLMGYPDSFQIPVSDTQAYRQFGNSVAVPVVAALAEAVVAALSSPSLVQPETVSSP